MPLSRLTRIDPHEYWKDEAKDFTPWLAQGENIELLGEVLGLVLEVEGVEKDVGPFRADIVCRESGGERLVLIENQLEKTDHRHLGQLLTYASGLKACVIVWIARRFTDEHRAALDWLNLITGNEFSFFGLEVELWRIDNSPLAPRFNVVCQPNEWSKGVQQASGLSDVKHGQLEFWTAFAAHMQEHSTIPPARPRPDRCMDLPIGRSGFAIRAVASEWETVSQQNAPELRVELLVQSEEAGEHFAALMMDRAAIETDLALSSPVTWYEKTGQKRRRIYTRTEGNYFDQAKREQHLTWLRQTVERFDRVFRRRVAEL